MAGKWPRRPMGAFFALAPNPIGTRALATRALATAPESAGIGDMQGKATPGLGALGGGIAGTIGGLLGALGEAAVEEGTEHAGEAVEGGATAAEGAGAVAEGTAAAEEGTAEEAQEQAAREFIERFNASGEKALDRLHGAQADHILHSNLHPEEHDWKQPFDGQEPTSEQVKSLLKKAIREGQESAHEDRLSQFERSIEYNGRRVFVRFVKGADGLVKHISTGYFKGE